MGPASASCTDSYHRLTYHRAHSFAASQGARTRCRTAGGSKVPRIFRKGESLRRLCAPRLFVPCTLPAMYGPCRALPSQPRAQGLCTLHSCWGRTVGLHSCGTSAANAQARRVTRMPDGLSRRRRACEVIFCVLYSAPGQGSPCARLRRLRRCEVAHAYNCDVVRLPFVQLSRVDGAPQNLSNESWPKRWTPRACPRKPGL